MAIAHIMGTWLWRLYHEARSGHDQADAWLDGTVMVLCDIIDHHSHADGPHSPRAILKRQVERAAALGFDAMMATELEFFILRKALMKSANQAFAIWHRSAVIMKTIIFCRPPRKSMSCARCATICGRRASLLKIPRVKPRPVRKSSTSNMPTRWRLPITMTIAKHAAAKEIGWQGHAVSFMPKWHHDRVGSSVHIHQSLWQGGKPAFYDPEHDLGMSQVMSQYLAGAEIQP